MAGLSKRLARDVARPQRDRGDAYFREGRVRRLPTDDSDTAFLVRGTRPYHVSFSYEAPFLVYGCNCPFFLDRNEPCKHVWAAILELDRDPVAQREQAAAQLVPETIADEIFAADADFGDEPDPVRERPVDRPDRAVRPGATSRQQEQRWVAWVRALEMASEHSAPGVFDPERRQIRYTIDLERCYAQGRIAVDLSSHDRKRDGTWSVAKPLALRYGEAERLEDPHDRRVFALLRGNASREWIWSDTNEGERIVSPAILDGLSAHTVLPALEATGRCVVKGLRGEEPLRCELGTPWQLELVVSRGDDGALSLEGTLARDGEVRPVSWPDLFVKSGFLLAGGTVARFDHARAFPLLVLLREEGRLSVPADDAPAFVAKLLSASADAPVALPHDLRYETIDGKPRPSIRILKPPWAFRATRLRARLFFDYADRCVPAGDRRERVVDEVQRHVIRRNRDAERAASGFLEQSGFRLRSQRADDGEPEFDIAPGRLPKVVPRLVAAGWRVEAEGKIYRPHGDLRISITTGIDWLELRGDVDYGGQSVPLPRLLEAMRRGESTVLLGDGTLGVLPEAWLARYAPIAALADARDDHVRFGRRQAAVLDALVSTMPEVRVDEAFEKVRERLAGFAGVRAEEPPAGFRGELRGYQKDALGWFRFLREFGFGGCLADDMGLGKTVQVLALLESRRRGRGGSRRPSLVVAPRSVVFNWLSEAARFTPRLRTLDYTGVDRAAAAARLSEHDLVVTTYGTLRRDAEVLSGFEFDYVVLDEAQAIKNSGSQAARAARLLRGEQRLALTGTPIENHLGELWSLFEFLNPGMLGASTRFAGWMKAAADPDDEARRMLSRAIAPFILRRTKDVVTPELPRRTEQTLVCELEASQRRLYDELRDYYRASLLARVRREGLAKSKIHVLEALLRLRQAACHPGLVDRRYEGRGSAKLDLLDERLAELLDEGHKALVFSQFTSLLALVRKRIDASRGGSIYAYLDGATPAAARTAAVRRFQEEEGCRLFLVSLKAGGVGLNLTSAGYVFLLDPWWNPAVEAQAIDRAHRIGQNKPVFAYRIVAADTVEEKILALQAQKRALADAILAAKGSALASLTREDLELLLG